MNIDRLKRFVLLEIEKIDNKKDAKRILGIFSEIELNKIYNPLDKSSHYSYAKKRHKEIIENIIKETF